jgi:hypothetical protein
MMEAAIFNSELFMSAFKSEFTVPLLVAAFGLLLCVASYYPGYAMNDSISIYKSIKSDTIGDWFPPCFSLVWRELDAIWPGQQTLFLLQNILYWSAVFLIGSTVAYGRGVKAAIVAIGFCFFPYFLFGLGVVQREPLLAAAVLLAFSMLWFRRRTGHLHPLWVKIGASGLCLFAVSIRHEAIIILPFFAAYLVVEKGDIRQLKTWKKIGALFVVLVIMSTAVSQFCKYCTDANKSYASSTLIYFDLKGISYFMPKGEYVSFGEFDSEQAKEVYDGREWSRHYLTHDQRDMDYFKIIHQRHWSDLQGVRKLWLSLIAQYPLSYLKHRFNHFIYQLEIKDTPPNVLKIAVKYADDPNVIYQNYDDLANAKITGVADVFYRYGIAKSWGFFAFSFVLLFFYRCFKSTEDKEFFLVLLLGGITYSLIFLIIGVAHQARYFFWHNVATVVALGLLCAQMVPPATSKAMAKATKPKKAYKKKSQTKKKKEWCLWPGSNRHVPQRTTDFESYHHNSLQIPTTRNCRVF